MLKSHGVSLIGNNVFRESYLASSSYHCKVTTCLSLNSLYFFLASSAKMGLVETKLAIIPGGGMNCWLPSLGIFDLALDWVQGRAPSARKAAFGLKRQMLPSCASRRVQAQHLFDLWGWPALAGFLHHPMVCVVSLLARSP